MLHGKFASTDQKHYPDLGSDASYVWNLGRHLVKKPVVVSQNIDCFLWLRVFKLEPFFVFMEKLKFVLFFSLKPGGSQKAFN